MRGSQSQSKMCESSVGSVNVSMDRERNRDGMGDTHMAVRQIRPPSEVTHSRSWTLSRRHLRSRSFSLGQPLRFLDDVRRVIAASSSPEVASPPSDWSGSPSDASDSSSDTPSTSETSEASPSSSSSSASGRCCRGRECFGGRAGADLLLGRPSAALLVDVGLGLGLGLLTLPGGRPRRF